MSQSSSALPYHYHPYELAVCGYSGSGKTTLICKLIKALAEHLELAYVKHQAHCFQMDHPGKDSHEVRLAGAQMIAIADSRHAGFIDASAHFQLDHDQRFLKCDGLVIEGGKDLDVAKLVVVDADLKILEALPSGAVALCGDTAIEHPLPWFHRDAVDELAAWLQHRWQIGASSLKGLILSGGKSQRMGADKGLLDYHGTSQIRHLAALARTQCTSVFLSAREGQYPTDEGSSLPQLIDRFHDIGPLAGLLSAHMFDSKAAWLVLGCDMPNLDAHFLSTLVAARQPQRFATLSESGYGLEPLAAIYEAKFFRQALAFLGQGVTSLQSMLMQSRKRVFKAPFAEALLNINDPSARHAWFEERKL